MIKGDYEKLDELAQHNLCAEHKKPLTVAWNPEESCYVLRCAEGHYPNSLTRQLSFHQQFKQGKRPEEEKVARVRQKHEAKEKKGVATPNAVTFPGVPATDLATGELLPKDILLNLVAFAQELGLRAELCHVVIMYSRPYITIDGYLYHANKSGRQYHLSSRPLSSDERANYQLAEGDHGWLAELITDGGQRIFNGLGIVTKEEMTEESKRKPGQLRSPVVAAHPWQLAQKRAEWQALRRGFPIGESTELSNETGD